MSELFLAEFSEQCPCCEGRAVHSLDCTLDDDHSGTYEDLQVQWLTVKAVYAVAYRRGQEEMREQIAAGLHCESDEPGDPCAVCRAMRDSIRALPIKEQPCT